MMNKNFGKIRPLTRELDGLQSTIFVIQTCNGKMMGCLSELLVTQTDYKV